jgi:hypothetical protein
MLRLIGAGDEQAVRVARRRDKLDAEPAQIPADGAEDVHVRLAGVAAARAHLPQPQRAAEKLFQLFIQRDCKTQFLPAGFAEQQIFAPPNRHLMIACLRDGFSGARLDAGGAEDTFAQIERDGFARLAGDGLRGADRNAGIAAFGTFRSLDAQCAAMAVWQRGGGPSGNAMVWQPCRRRWVMGFVAGMVKGQRRSRTG